MNVLSGDGPVAWSLIAMDIVIAVVFGGLTAWSTMKLAQGAERGGALSGVEDRELWSSPPPDLTVSRRARAHADER